MVEMGMSNEEADQIARDVSRYSILVGFLLIIVFVVPCVAFALLSKYCQKQPSNRKRTRYSGTYEDDVLGGSMQRRLSQVSRISINLTGSMKDGTDSSSSSQDFGMFGQVELTANRIVCLERIGANELRHSYSKLSIQRAPVSVAPGLTCLETWKAYAPSAVCKSKKFITIKKLTDPKNIQHSACLRAELNSLSRIPAHPHLLNLLGVCMSGGVPTALMLEYPPYGTLHSFLICKAKAKASGSVGAWPGLTTHITEEDLVVACRDPGRSLHDILLDPAVRSRPFQQPLTERFIEQDELVFAIQIASVMEHLASKNIPHHKLSTENLVVSAGYFLKLTGVDFENPALHRSSSLIRLKRAPSGRNLIKWDAPEVMEKGEYSEFSEVWRFGMTLWEISSIADTPFADMPYRQLLEMLKRGERPHKPENCSDRLFNLMSGCWAMSPEERPSFHQLVGRLRGILDTGSRKTSTESQSAPSPTPTSTTSLRPQLLTYTNSSQSFSVHQRLLRRPYGSIRSNISTEPLLLITEPNTPMAAAEQRPAGYIQTDV